MSFEHPEQMRELTFYLFPRVNIPFKVIKMSMKQCPNLDEKISPPISTLLLKVVNIYDSEQKYSYWLFSNLA